MRRLRQFAATLAALALFVYLCAAADAKLALRGRVTDENGLPVGDAQVKLEVSGGLPITAVSDDAGFFTLLNLPPGEYTVRVEKPGYFVLANQKVQLTAESTEFGFTLNQDRKSVV